MPERDRVCLLSQWGNTKRIQYHSYKSSSAAIFFASFYLLFFPLALPDGDIRQTYQRLVVITFINIICPGYSERFIFFHLC